MKKVLFFAALAACLFTACQKEMNAPAGTTLTASILQTRTSLQSDMKVFWSAGDQIFVNGQVSKPVTAAGASASFQFDAALSAPFKAVYPAAFTQDGEAITLPAEQAAADGTFADGVAPMIAYAESGNTLQFKHVAAYIRVPVKSAKTITSVTLTGNNGEQLCGDFAVDYTAGTIATTDATDENRAVRVLVGKSEATLVIALPAATYGKGLTLTAEDADGKKMTYVKASTTELVAGQVNTLPQVVFEAVPEGEGSGTEADPYLIKTAADLAAMAGKVVKGSMTYFKLMDNIDMSSITEWTPVNVDFNNAAGPEGIMFDGNHKVLSNWRWVNTTTKYPGFVGVLHGEIKDLVFADCYVESQVNSPTGLICGWAGVSNASLHGRLENVHAVRCTVKNSFYQPNLGGLAGSAHNTEFINCSFDGLVERLTPQPTQKTSDSDKIPSNYYGTGGMIGSLPQADVNGLNVIRNCSTSGSIKDMSRSTGGVIGFINNKAIVQLKNVHSTMDIHNTRDVVGGITGYFGGGSLENCWFDGNIVSEQTSSSFVGGLVPHTNWGIELYNCHSKGTITCPGDIAGGIIGQCNAVASSSAAQSGPCIIKECWSTMDIKSRGAAGGIIGRSSTDQPLTIENCWYSGTISGNAAANAQAVGGILGDGPKNTTIKDCWNDADIIGGFGIGGIAGRLFGRQGSSASLDADVNSTMTGCIYWGPGIKTSTDPGERASNHYSSGALVGCSSRPNTLKDSYRNPEMTLQVYRCDLLNNLFDHENADPSHPLVQPYNYGDAPVQLSETEGDTEDFKWFSPYHGKAAPAGATISSLARTIGWDESVWDLSGDKPMLKNTPLE